MRFGSLSETHFGNQNAFRSHLNLLVGPNAFWFPRIRSNKYFLKFLFELIIFLNYQCVHGPYSSKTFFAVCLYSTLWFELTILLRNLSPTNLSLFDSLWIDFKVLSVPVKSNRFSSYGCIMKSSAFLNLLKAM